MDKKIKVARLSIISNTTLTLGKLIVGFSIGSIAVISEGIHSASDLVASLIAFFSVSKSAQPADRKYRFGYGKYENVASIIEALLILGAAIFIVIESIPRLINPVPITSYGLGMAVMGVCACVNLVISQIILKVAKETDSPALAANGWHLRTDVYTSAGIFLALLIIMFTGWHIVDPLIAIGVSFLILKAAYDLIRDSMKSILDESLPEEEIREINRVLEDYSDWCVEYHQLRTRKAGSERHIDLHLVTAYHLSVRQVHDVCDEIESRIANLFPEASVLIHAEPCNSNCNECSKGAQCVTCAYTQIKSSNTKKSREV